VAVKRMIKVIMRYLPIEIEIEIEEGFTLPCYVPPHRDRVSNRGRINL
jgi:hypothetical protein